MKNPFSIIHDDEEFTCSWCQIKFLGIDEGELLIHEKHCDLLCGKCLEKYIAELLKRYEEENT